MPTKPELLERLAKAEAEIARLRAEDSPRIADPAQALVAIRAACAERPEQESFVAVLLNARQKVLATRVVHVGTLSQVDVHPRELFRDAVRMAAHSLIMAHNHPSGDPRPSEGDISLTRRMVEAGEILGIPVLDHIVVTDHDACSLAALGLV